MHQHYLDINKDVHGTVGFSELLGSLVPMPPDVQTNPKFNDA